MMKVIKIWCAINADNTLSMHSEEPVRNTDLGVWISNAPFVHSIIYKQMSDFMRTANISFENDPEYFEINMELPEVKGN